MGYAFKEPKRRDKPTGLRKAGVREYITEQEIHQVVYIDGSCIHVNHKCSMTWVGDNDGISRGNLSKGQRLTIVHAIMRDGPVIAPKFHDGAGGFKGQESFHESGTSTSGRGHGNGRGRGHGDIVGRKIRGSRREAVVMMGQQMSGGLPEVNIDEHRGSHRRWPLPTGYLEEPTYETCFPADERVQSDYHEHVDGDAFVH